MGFTKRYITTDQLIENLNARTITNLFKGSDAFMFDNSVSVKIYESYLTGLTDDELFNMFVQELNLEL